MKLFGVRVFADTEVNIDSKTLHDSLKGMKVELNRLQIALGKYKWKSIKMDRFEYYAEGARRAKKILILERIVKETTICELKAKVKEQIEDYLKTKVAH